MTDNKTIDILIVVYNKICMYNNTSSKLSGT